MISEALGGYRDLCVSNVSGSSGTSILTASSSSGGYLDLSQTTGVYSVATVQWDGNDGACTISPTGLGGVDLTDGGFNDGVVVRVVAADGLPVVVTLRIYTNASNWKQKSVTLSSQITGGAAAEVVFRFADLSGGAGTLDPTNVGAVELILDASGASSGGADIRIGLMMATTAYDYGDLPLNGAHPVGDMTQAGFSSSVLAARHVPGRMHLGSSVDTEAAGAASVDADGDDLDEYDDEDGVIPVEAGSWTPGTPSRAGGNVQITFKGCAVTGDNRCRIIGWVDWNRDGEFSVYPSEEEIVYMTGLSEGIQQISFAIPSGTSFSDVRYYARFRICPIGAAACESPTATDVLDGEIEDYAWDWGAPPTAVGVSRVSAEPQGNAILLTWETETEIDTYYFDVYRSDSIDGEYARVSEEIIPAQAPDSIESHTYTWLNIDVVRGQRYYYRVEAVGAGSSAFSDEPVSAYVPFYIFLPRLSRK